MVLSHKKEDHFQTGSDTEEADGVKFSYKIAFHPRQDGLFVRVVFKDKLINRFEKFGINLMNLTQASPAVHELDSVHRSFIQQILRFAKFDTAEEAFVIPKKQIAFFLARLSKFSKVDAFESFDPIRFSAIPLNPLVHLLKETSNQIVLQASFENEETKKHFSLSEGFLFQGNRPWLFHENVFYPIKSTAVTSLLNDFNSEGVLTLTGHEAADFIENILPTLSKKAELITPENFYVPQIFKSTPEVSYSISEDDIKDKLILNIHFIYRGQKVAPSQGESDLLVELKEDGKNILIQRDLVFEKLTLDQFYAQGFRRVASNQFETGGESALDFISEELPQLKKQGNLQGDDHLKHFKVFSNLGKSELKGNISSVGMDWFSVNLDFEVEKIKIPFEIIRNLIQSGKRYLAVPGKGFAKINQDQILDFEKRLAEFETEFDEEGKIKLSQFHAPYLDSLIKVDWSQHESLYSAIQSLKTAEKIPNYPAPSHLSAILRNYQLHGFDWLNFLHEHHFHGILADDMGLGKTLQLLTFLQSQKDRGEKGPSLVIAPTSVVFNWLSEAKKFTPNLKVLLHVDSQRQKNFSEMDQMDMVITSYAIFRRDADQLAKIQWATVALDEAQNIKNYRSKTAILMKELKSRQRWALTGTPLENRLSELWSIFNFLMPGFLGSFTHFQRKYQQPIELQQEGEVLEHLRKRIFPFVLRRLKDEVATELPPKTEIIHYSEMEEDQRKLYQEILAACRTQIFSQVEEEGIEKSQISIFTALLRLRQACCHPHLLGHPFNKKKIESGKMNDFKDLILEVLSEGHRILVFSQFVEMLGIIRKWFEEQNIIYEYLDGRTRKREEKISNFQNNKNVSAFLISLRAGGTGLNLTGADYVIHYDPWWNPAVQDQATDRAHRLGQLQHVFSYKLITKDSVEEKILALQERKKSLAQGVLRADSSLGKKLSIEDLEYLFS